MGNERNTDKLAGYLIKLGGLAIVLALCWYFKNVLIYIIAAFVVSLIGRPVMRLLRKIKIKGKSAPEWLLAILTIIIIIALLILLITQLIPIVSSIIKDASSLQDSTYFESNPIDKLNEWIIGLFPNLDHNFNIVTLVTEKVRELVDFGKVSGIVGSVASMVTSLFVALFSVVFISFFFLKEEGLFERIICALVPDKHELTLSKTLGEIKELLSRYFVGLFIEMLGVAVVDFLGLWIIARLDFSYAIGIAFIAGLLNVIPYVGPIIGEAIGVLFGIVLKLGTGAGLNVNIWIFALIILAIMLTAQLIDNFIYQPLIYSTSIKAHPLEIFIVLLMAGHIGGTIGMLVAIPAYTVLRVIAIRFFYQYKVIQRLVPDLSEEDKIIENID
ncbi:MAG: AI-2E family transporter [Bacteroidales bacterium]|jgi:predicted PurR-regulated permease PerM|nr:AI-2E family transporter [Bacteroidales bacterium]